MSEPSSPASDQGEPAIIVTRQQTRFQADEQSSNPREIDVDGLTISLAPSAPSASGTKGAKTKAVGKEILSDVHLKLKAGVRYCLIGRNGTGKSTLLKAIYQRQIPGISPSMRIVMLQQTINNESRSGGTSSSELEANKAQQNGAGNDLRTVLEVVMGFALSDVRALHDYEVLSKTIEKNDDPAAQIKAWRQIEYERKKEDLLRAQKSVNLRSGSRGFKARKELIQMEEVVAQAKDRASQSVGEISSGDAKDELQRAFDMMEDLRSQIDSMNLEDLETRAQDILQGLGFKKPRMQQTYVSLSGGWKMRCLLAGTLLKEADLMLIDEPTNFLDLSGILWLEGYLKYLNEKTNCTMVVVSHDRTFVENVCDEVVILRDRSLKYFRGTLSEYEQDFHERKLYMLRMKEASDRQTARFKQTIAQNIQQGKKMDDTNRLKQAKSRQKRLDERSGMQVNAQGHRFKASRDAGGLSGGSKRPGIVVPTDEASIHMSLPQAAELRFPGPLVSLEHISFAYTPKGTQVLQDITLTVHMGDRVGIMGLNGSGKTTLIRILVGQLQPSKGNVSHHPRLRLGYYSQHAVEDLQATGRRDPTLTALGALGAEEGNDMSEADLRGLLGSFGLPGRLASDVPVANLSGGELVRLALSKVVWNHPHLLVLDEISTHLDFDTVTALQDALAAFDGAVVLISHDRSLIQAVIEGQRRGLGNDDDDDDEDDGNPSLSGTRTALHARRSVLALRGGGKLEKLSSVSDFEAGLKKKMKISW